MTYKYKCVWGGTYNCIPLVWASSIHCESKMRKKTRFTSWEKFWEVWGNSATS